jgi:ribonuclease HI
MKLAIDWVVEACFHLMHIGNRVESSTNQLTQSRWQKPPTGFLKVNKDGAFSAETKTDATGAIIRREDGSFLTAMAQRLPSVTSALMAEAEACRHRLRLLPRMPQQRVILETGSQEFVTLWRSRDDHRLEITPTLRDIQELVTTFISFSVVHVRQMGNATTHLCARNVLSCNPIIWENTPPSFLL